MSWQQAIERTVIGLGYELVELERSGGGLLRVYIDRVPGKAYPNGPGEFVTVDDCETVTRQLQYVLEVEQCDYARLEVSSPGLDRPLRNEADYMRFVGQDVDVTLKLPMAGLAGRKKFRGQLLVRDGGWRLLLAPPAEVKTAAKTLAKGKGVAASKKALDAAPQQVLDFVFDEVREARLVPVIDFKGRSAAPTADVPVSAGE